LFPIITDAKTKFRYGKNVAMFLQPAIPQFKMNIYNFSICGEVLDLYSGRYEREILITLRLNIFKKFIFPMGYRITNLKTDYKNNNLRLSHGPFISIRYEMD